MQFLLKFVKLTFSDAVQDVESVTQLWAMDPAKIIPRQTFCCVQVAEFLLHYLLKGKPHKSYPSALGKKITSNSSTVVLFVKRASLNNCFTFR